MNFKNLEKRATAYVIDCIICYSIAMLLIQWAILSQFRDQLGLTDEWFKNSLNMEMYVLLPISLPVWIYFTLMDSLKTKGTLGKRLLKLRVIDTNSGKRLSLGRSFTRSFLKLLPWEIAHLGIIFPTPMYFDESPEIRTLTIFGIVLFLIYTISILLSNNNQSVYDRLLQTRVYDKSQKGE